MSVEQGLFERASEKFVQNTDYLVKKVMYFLYSHAAVCLLSSSFLNTDDLFAISSDQIEEFIRQNTSQLIRQIAKSTASWKNEILELNDRSKLYS